MSTRIEGRGLVLIIEDARDLARVNCGGLDRVRGVVHGLVKRTPDVDVEAVPLELYGIERS